MSTKLSKKKIVQKGVSAASKESAEKAKKEQERLQKALQSQINKEIIGDFDLINIKSFAEKCSNKLIEYILKAIDNIKEYEVKKYKAPDPFPENAYILLNEKLNPLHKTRAIVKKGDLKPKKTRIPKKKGHSDNHTMDDDNDDDNDGPSDEHSENLSSQTTANDSQTDSEKKVSKKNITQVQRTAKVCLQFIINRFVYEIYSIETNTKARITNRNEFTKFVFENTPEEFTSQITTVIIPAVDNFGHLVYDIPDYQLTQYITSIINNWFDDRQYLISHIAEYIVSYLKLLGFILAKFLWVKPQGINSNIIEMAMRILDINTTESYFTSHKVDPSKLNFGLASGIILQMHMFENTLYPQVPKKPKTSTKSNKSITLIHKKRVNSNTNPSQLNDQDEQAEQDEQDDQEEQYEQDEQAEQDEQDEQYEQDEQDLALDNEASDDLEIDSEEIIKINEDEIDQADYEEPEEDTEQVIEIEEKKAPVISQSRKLRGLKQRKK